MSKEVKVALEKLNEVASTTSRNVDNISALLASRKSMMVDMEMLKEEKKSLVETLRYDFYST